jgi:hypothetical protein
MGLRNQRGNSRSQSGRAIAGVRAGCAFAGRVFFCGIDMVDAERAKLIFPDSAVGHVKIGFIEALRVSGYRLSLVVFRRVEGGLWRGEA